MSIKSLTIFCSSSNNLDKKYYDLARKIGIFLAKKSIRIIYGGGNVGLMGQVSLASHENGGDIIGIIPEFLIKKEQLKKITSSNIIVKNMTERKKKLFELGDAFLVLPGGSGTIEEATEVISWRILGLHKKRIIIFNYDNYWDMLIKLYENAKNKNFGDKNLQNICEDIKTYDQFTNLF